MNDALYPIRHLYAEEAASAPPAPGTPQHTEYEVLRTTKAAVEQLPPQRPDAAVVEAVMAAAVEAANAYTLLPLRLAYEESDDVLAPDDPRATEYELLRTTKAAVEQLPPQRPDAGVLAAIAAAAQAPAGPRRAEDRPARPRGARRRFGAWIGVAASFVIVAVTALWALNNGPALQSEPEALSADMAEAAPATPPEASEETRMQEPVDDLLAFAPPTVAPQRRNRVAESSADANTAGAGPISARPVSPAAAAPAPAREDLADAASELTGPETESMRDEPVTLTAADWEAGEDVRILSLRLQQLSESSEGLAWDESPVPFGTADDAQGGRTDALQTVGASRGRPANVPARVDVRARAGGE